MSTVETPQQTRLFYLVQRVKRSTVAEIPVEKRKGLQRVSNVFGYGNLGDYDLDYMGSAEFEWGAIPEAYDRFSKAKKLGYGQHEYNGHLLDFVWIKTEGEPFADWEAWVEGRPYISQWGDECSRRGPCEGKESAYELRDRLDGEPEPKWGWRADVWWALTENVMWAFAEDGHLERMFESMGKGKNSLRGAPR